MEATDAKGKADVLEEIGGFKKIFMSDLNGEDKELYLHLVRNA